MKTSNTTSQGKTISLRSSQNPSLQLEIQQQQQLLQQQYDLAMAMAQTSLPLSVNYGIDSSTMQQLYLSQQLALLNNQLLLGQLGRQKQSQELFNFDMAALAAAAAAATAQCVFPQPQAFKKSRLIWTPELSDLFVTVVESLGWEVAMPKDILKKMNVEGLTRENVASHLQKYRLKKRKQLHGEKTSATRSGEEDEVNSTTCNQKRKRMKVLGEERPRFKIPKHNHCGNDNTHTKVEGICQDLANDNQGSNQESSSKYDFGIQDKSQNDT